MAKYSRPERLNKSHSVEGFRCGKRPLDEWLCKYSLINQSAGMANVFVATCIGADVVAGYYALATGGVEPEDAPLRIAKGVPRQAIPVILLARFAVHEDHQGKGLGRALLRDALSRVDIASEAAGVRALLIHAKDDDAREFYMKMADFEPSPSDSLHLFLLMKDLRLAITT